MKTYKVVAMSAKDARRLQALCASEAERLQGTAEFGKRSPNAVEQLTNILMLEAKAYIIGLIELHEVRVDLPGDLQRPFTFSFGMRSKQQYHRTQIGTPPYTVPAFPYRGNLVPADEIPHVLSYECIDMPESFEMYHKIIHGGLVS